MSKQDMLTYIAWVVVLAVLAIGALIITKG